MQPQSAAISQVYSKTMQPVLCVGLVCLDQVTVVDKFPAEDTDQRSIDQYKVTLSIMMKIMTIFQGTGWKC